MSLGGTLVFLRRSISRINLIREGGMDHIPTFAALYINSDANLCQTA